MSKANKTQPTAISPDAYVKSLDSPRREEGLALLKIYERLTGEKPKMWGDSLIGFGQYHYKYDSGHEGDFFRAGFSPRKSAISIYTMIYADELKPLLDKMGKHKTGKSCIYIKSLDSIDQKALEEVITTALGIMAKRYPN